MGCIYSSEKGTKLKTWMKSKDLQKKSGFCTNVECTSFPFPYLRLGLIVKKIKLCYDFVSIIFHLLYSNWWLFHWGKVMGSHSWSIHWWLGLMRERPLCYLGNLRMLFSILVWGSSVHRVHKAMSQGWWHKLHFRCLSISSLVDPAWYLMVVWCALSW
jgi:hypothetical protein